MALKIQYGNEVRNATPEEIAKRDTKIQAKEDLENSVPFRRPRLIVTINKECDRRIKRMVAEYPEAEQMTFDQQEKEARSFIADPENDTPLLDSLASSRGVTKEAQAARIIEKADLFAAVSGQIIGHRQKLRDQIEAATSPQDLDVINPLTGWPSV